MLFPIMILVICMKIWMRYYIARVVGTMCVCLMKWKEWDSTNILFQLFRKMVAHAQPWHFSHLLLSWKRSFILQKNNIVFREIFPLGIKKLEYNFKINCLLHNNCMFYTNMHRKASIILRLNWDLERFDYKIFYKHSLSRISMYIWISEFWTY